MYMADFIWNFGILFVGIFIGRRFEKKQNEAGVEGVETPKESFSYSMNHLTIFSMPVIKRNSEYIELFDTFKITLTGNKKE